MFRHTTQIRRWALRVLLLWLFGIATGVAHACLKTDGPPAPAVVAATEGKASPHDHAPQAPAASAACHEAADDDADAAQLNCQAFCERASVSVPPVKTGPDEGAGPAPAAALPTALALPVAAAPVQRWVPRGDGLRPPPIPIAFLRLTR